MINENNKVHIIGTILEDITYSHETLKERFYQAFVEAERTSGRIDIVPILVSERICDISGLVGKHVEINGDFRSFNKMISTEKSKLQLNVFVKEIAHIDDDFFIAQENEIFLDGYICKEPIYRKTPLGREIADLLVAVNRSYGKADYIPCICWGRNACYASNFEIGTHVCVEGRIQSREYIKKLSEEESETRIAYEVSANRIESTEENAND